MFVDLPLNKQTFFISNLIHLAWTQINLKWNEMKLTLRSGQIRSASESEKATWRFHWICWSFRFGVNTQQSRLLQSCKVSLPVMVTHILQKWIKSIKTNRNRQNQQLFFSESRRCKIHFDANYLYVIKTAELKSFKFIDGWADVFTVVALLDFLLCDAKINQLSESN